MEEKILGSEHAQPWDNRDRILGSEDGFGNNNNGTEDGSDRGSDVNANPTFSTLHGGLTSIPQNFEDTNGDWKYIHSDNPFEVLYLDYKQYTSITPEIIQKNFDILSAFWAAKNRLMNSGAREKIKKRYGEDTVDGALNKLEKAFNKIKTKEGIELYRKEIDGKRYANGIKAITDYIDFALEDGELSRQEALRIIKKGVENDLNEIEVRNHLNHELMARNFKPRSAITHADFFDNEWLTDEAFEIKRKRVIPDVFIFGKKVSSLKEIGHVLFVNTDKAKIEYLHNAIYLPQDVAKLENSEKALEFEKIINSENDINKRFLKVVYYLNPDLPFVIDNISYPTINHLFDKTSYDYALFLNTANNYHQGFIHIWLTQCDTANAAKLTPGFDYNDFLKFLYQINKNHPFYINEEKFDTPLQLIEKAKKSKFYWGKISDAMLNGQLPVWFAGIGKYEWIAQYNKQTEAFIDADYYNTEDKKLAAVQTLIQIIDPLITYPKIAAIPKSMQLLSVEGSHAIEQPVLLKLENEGFLKAKILLDRVNEGIWLHVNEATFQSQSLHTETKVLLHINAPKLIKDKVHSFNIEVKTIYETLTIPVAIKVVFPKKAYYIQLIKYAFVGAIFFGGIRFLVGAMTSTNSWLENEYDNYRGINNLPENYFAYFIALVLFITVLISSFFIIKKIEKI